MVVAGRPSMGKTTFAMNIAESVALQNDQPVAVFSMEMPGDALAMRMLSSLGRINQQSIRTGRLDAVLFFSPRTAKTFVTLAHAADIADACRGVRAVCLSPAVANAAQALPWRDVHTAERPERSALLRTLDDLAGAAAPAPDQT